MWGAILHYQAQQYRELETEGILRFQEAISTLALICDRVTISPPHLAVEEVASLRLLTGGEVWGEGEEEVVEGWQSVESAPLPELDWPEWLEWLEWLVPELKAGESLQ